MNVNASSKFATYNKSGEACDKPPPREAPKSAFNAVCNESVDIGKGMILSTIGVMAGMHFNGFMDGLFQLILPVQEKDLSNSTDITTYRFLLTLFLLTLMIAFTIILSLESFPSISAPVAQCRPRKEYSFSDTRCSALPRRRSRRRTPVI